VTVISVRLCVHGYVVVRDGLKFGHLHVGIVGRDCLFAGRLIRVVDDNIIGVFLLFQLLLVVEFGELGNEVVNALVGMLRLVDGDIWVVLLLQLLLVEFGELGNEVVNVLLLTTERRSLQAKLSLDHRDGRTRREVGISALHKIGLPNGEGSAGHAWSALSDLLGCQPSQPGTVADQEPHQQKLLEKVPAAWLCGDKCPDHGGHTQVPGFQGVVGLKTGRENLRTDDLFTVSEHPAIHFLEPQSNICIEIASVMLVEAKLWWGLMLVRSSRRRSMGLGAVRLRSVRLRNVGLRNCCGRSGSAHGRRHSFR
jgi:hypothetical protein